MRELTRGEQKIVRLAQNGRTVPEIVELCLGPAETYVDVVTGRRKQVDDPKRKNLYQKIRNLLVAEGIVIPTAREHMDYESIFDNLLAD